MDPIFHVIYRGSTAGILKLILDLDAISVPETRSYIKNSLNLIVSGLLGSMSYSFCVI